MSKIPYVFLWSPKYEMFAKVLKAGIRNYDGLEDKSFFIPQEVFDSNSYKSPGHLMCGCSLKLQLTYDMLMSLPTNSYFIFSDADILIFPQKPLMELLNIYIKLEADAVFMRETMDKRFYNVGFSLLRVNDLNRQLFVDALKMYENQPDGLDGSFINACLKSYKGSCFFFPPELVATTCTVKELDAQVTNMGLMRSKLIVFQALCDANKKSEDAIKQKLEQYQILGVPVKI
jgi:hypothetical protein